MVTLSDLEELLRREGWTPKFSKSHRQTIAAAQQRRGAQVTTRYIATENKLKGMTEDDVLAKLSRPSKGQEVEQSENK